MLCRSRLFITQVRSSVSGLEPQTPCRLDEIIVFRQLTKGEVKEIADIMLREVFKRADTKGIKIDVTERFKVRRQLSPDSTGVALLSI